MKENCGTCIYFQPMPSNNLIESLKPITNEYGRCNAPMETETGEIVPLDLGVFYRQNCMVFDENGLPMFIPVEQA